MATIDDYFGPKRRGVANARVVTGKEITQIHLSVKLGKDRLSNFLPNKLMEKILLLLPVKSILCFQSISNLWNRFLSSPLFARIHPLSSSSALSNPFTFFLSSDDYVMSLHDIDNELSCCETKIRASMDASNHPLKPGLSDHGQQWRPMHF
ncbi:hypothetical protein AMTR_s00111p00096160 [Amborella trichopoda]|uniref:F-box domain-containing protein n=1 Tax=Amborella trichopoda TaxID=13333 RepID=W1NSV8_AMBTC|nr:hypothetical protein AMTR_s00111p00096160 [Amborella trichopoda]